MSISLRLLAASAVCCLLSVAQAGTIFSNLGPGNSYLNNSGLAVGGGVPNGFYTIAMPFTPSADFTLTEIDVAMTGAGSVNFGLASDSAGFPGVHIADWVLTGLPAIGTCCVLQTLTPLIPITVLSGIQYWLVAAPAAIDTAALWNYNSINYQGLYAFDPGHGSGFFLTDEPTLTSAYAVQGDEIVPEPMSVLIAGSGLSLLALLRLRKRKLNASSSR